MSYNETSTTLRLEALRLAVPHAVETGADAVELADAFFKFLAAESDGNRPITFTQVHVHDDDGSVWAGSNPIVKFSPHDPA